jgi:penicillin-binding protein 1C
VLPDIPTSFPTAEEGIVYTPRNYDGRYRGPMLARVALAGSENVPAVALASELGVPSLLRFLSRAGLTTFDKTAAYYGLGLTLGNAEVRLDELVAAYSAFARGGEWIQPTWRVCRDEEDACATSRETRRVVSPRTAFWITDILSDSEAREFAFGRGGSLELPFPVAVKTGTSQAYHDNWTIGYSRNVTVGVWVGNFDRRPLRNSSGVTGAAPIFHGVMLAAERRVSGPEFHQMPVLAASEDSVEREICSLSGHAANEWCPAKRHEWVAVERPLKPCDWHVPSNGHVVTDWPPDYRAWARLRAPSPESRASSLQPLASASAKATADKPNPTLRATSAGEPLKIVSPANGSTFLIDPTLRREFQTLSLRAVTAARGEIEWSVDGQLLGRVDPDGRLDWSITPGRHRITVRDASGRTAEAHVVVR